LLLSGYLLGLAQGFFVSLLATALLCAFHASTGSIWQMAGVWGEDSTTDELRKAKRRGLIWGFVNGVATSTGDVDHVVVTKRGGVVAVDSKYHAHLRSDTVQCDLASAASSARRTRLIMLSFGRSWCQFCLTPRHSPVRPRRARRQGTTQLLPQSRPPQGCWPQRPDRSPSARHA
jgi:hypothetical protein